MKQQKAQTESTKSVKY